MPKQTDRTNHGRAADTGASYFAPCKCEAEHRKPKQENAEMNKLIKIAGEVAEAVLACIVAVALFVLIVWGTPNQTSAECDLVREQIQGVR